MVEKKAVLYARVSTVKEEQEQSLEIQEEIIEQFCNDKGFKLVKPYYLEHGRSGTNIKKRPKFIAMMKDAGLKPVQSGSSDTFFENNGLPPNFNIIIVKEASRFSRNQTEALSVLKELKRNGVEVYFISTNTSTTDEDWEFKLGLYFNLSQTESKNLSVRVKMSKRHNAEKGRYAPAVVPYGYKRIYDEDGEKKIVKDEVESKVVEEIFQQYSEIGSHTLSRILNEKGILTKGGKTWTGDKITRLIQNPVYIGSPIVMKSKKTNLTDTKRVATTENERITIENAVEPIITIEDFNIAQNVRLSRTTNDNSRGKHKSKKDVFSEKLYCANCGARYVRHIGEGKKINYMCQTRRKQGLKKCPNKGIAFKLLMQGISDSRIRFNDMSNYSQLTTLNEGVSNLIDKNAEIRESIMVEIDDINTEIQKTFLYIRDLDKLSIQYETGNALLEQLHSQRITLEEQYSLVKDEAIERFISKVKQKEFLIKEAQKMEMSEHELILFQLNKVMISDDWVKYCYKVHAYDEEIEEYNCTFGDVIESIRYQSEADFEEVFQRDFRKLISRAEEQEMIKENIYIF